MVNQEQTLEELSNLAKTNAEEALISIKKMIKKRMVIVELSLFVGF